MQCLGITKKRKRCKNNCRILYCKIHRWQWFSIITFIALIGGLFQDVIKPIFSVFEQKQKTNDSYLNEPFIESDSFKILLLPIKTYESLNQGVLEESIINGIERENLIGIRKFAIKYLYNFKGKTSENERIYLLEKYKADLLLWGKFENNLCKNKLSCIQYQHRFRTNKYSEEFKSLKEISSFIKEVEQGYLTEDLFKDLYMLFGTNAMINEMHFSRADSCFTRAKELLDMPEDSLELKSMMRITMMNDLFDLIMGDTLRKLGVIPKESEINHWDYIRMMEDMEKRNKKSVFRVVSK